MLQSVSILHFLSWLTNIPLSERATVCLFIRQLMDIWAVSLFSCGDWCCCEHPCPGFVWARVPGLTVAPSGGWYPMSLKATIFRVPLREPRPPGQEGRRVGPDAGAGLGQQGRALPSPLALQCHRAGQGRAGQVLWTPAQPSSAGQSVADLSPKQAFPWKTAT